MRLEILISYKMNDSLTVHDKQEIADRNEHTNEDTNKKFPSLHLVLVCDGVCDAQSE